jgi:hypothetical protein
VALFDVDQILIGVMTISAVLGLVAVLFNEAKQ